MRHIGFLAALALLMFSAGKICAQTSVEMLEQDLKRFKDDRTTNSDAVMSRFYSTLETAEKSPDAAMDLFSQAGGPSPKLADVVSRYEHETPTEKAAREAQDAQTNADFAQLAQIYCGLMRFAALQIQSPKTPNLQQDWIDWLKATAQKYPQLPGNRELKNMKLQGSAISTYLNFHGWGTSDQGTWTVGDLPRLYRKEILEPLRSPPKSDLLPAWDTFIAMKAVGQEDNPRWTTEELPALQFDRATDAYTLSPTVDNIAALITIIKANPTHSLVDQWTAKVQVILDAMKANQPASSSATAPSAHPDTPQSDTSVPATMQPETPPPAPAPVTPGNN